MNKTKLDHLTPYFLAGGFLDAITYFYLYTVLRLYFYLGTSVLAVFAGMVNIVTFCQMDLKQGVTLNLLILSCSDFLFGVVMIFVNIFYFMHHFGFNSINGIATLFMDFTFRLMLGYPMNFSVVVTTVIAVVRCLSVVMPLSFRNIVTPKRQVVIIVCFGAFTTIFPAMTQLTFYATTDPENLAHRSQELMSSEQLAIIDVFNNIFFYGCLSIIILAMIFLIVAFKQSSRFQAIASTSNAKGKQISKESTTREVKLVKTVVTILVIFISCNIPLSLLAILRQTLSGFSPFGRFSYEKRILEIIVAISLNLNVCLNAPAYYFTNGAYRKIIQARLAKCSSFR